MLRGLTVKCLAVREICSIVHDVARAPRPCKGRHLARRSVPPADAVRSNNWQNRPNPARSARPVLV